MPAQQSESTNSVSPKPETAGSTLDAKRTSKSWLSTKNAYEKILDFVWPQLRVTPEERAAEDKKRKDALDTDCKRLDKTLRTAGDSPQQRLQLAQELLKGAYELHQAEIATRQGIESRLAMTLGFIALASTIATGIIGSQADHDDLSATPTLTLLSNLTIAYMTAQLICAGFASINGLKREDYLSPTGKALLTPASLDAEAALERAKSYLRCTTSYRKNNDEKISHLAVAHRATQNFLGGLLTLTVFAVISIALPIRITTAHPANTGSIIDCFTKSELWTSVPNSGSEPPTPEANPEAAAVREKPVAQASKLPKRMETASPREGPVARVEAEDPHHNDEVEHSPNWGSVTQTDPPVDECCSRSPVSGECIEFPFWVPCE